MFLFNALQTTGIQYIIIWIGRLPNWWDKQMRSVLLLPFRFTL